MALRIFSEILLLAVLAAYLIAAIHSILAFVNKRRSLQRVAHGQWPWVCPAHRALIADWAIDGTTRYSFCERLFRSWRGLSWLFTPSCSIDIEHKQSALLRCR